MRRICLAALAALILCLAAAVPASADYTPSGPLVADSGFRPNPDGYAFENYGGGEEKDLNAAQMVRLFGREVCENADGRCVLTTVARGWMRSFNAVMDGGHCMGFAATASLWHSGLGEPVAPSLLGATTTFGLSKSGAVERHIAYGFAFQALPSVQSQTRDHINARQLVAELKRLLPDRSQPFTLGIFKRDETGGHAITPFALEDRGAGRYGVLVYDNNYPGETRAMNVDVNRNTWNYQAAPNPKIKAGIYDGDGKVSHLSIMPLTPGLGEQDCFFCGAGAGAGKKKMTLAWASDPTTRRHSELVVVDRRKRVSGCADFGDGFTCRNRIPGVEQENLMVGGEQNWLNRVSPSYKLPFGRPYTVLLRGADLRRPAREGIAVIAPRRYVGLADVELGPGEVDMLRIGRGMRRVIFVNDERQTETPRLQLGLERREASYLFEVKARRVAEGAVLGLELHPKRRVLEIEGADARQTGRYRVKVVRSTARGNRTARRQVTLRAGQSLEIQYGELLRKRGKRR